MTIKIIDETQPVLLADDATRKARAEGLLRVVEDFEAEHGAITAEELAVVMREWSTNARDKLP